MSFRLSFLHFPSRGKIFTVKRDFSFTQKKMASKSSIQASYKSKKRKATIRALFQRLKSISTKSNRRLSSTSKNQAGVLGISGNPYYFHDHESDTSSVMLEGIFPDMVHDLNPEDVSEITSAYSSASFESDLSTRSYYSESTMSTASSDDESDCILE